VRCLIACGRKLGSVRQLMQSVHCSTRMRSPATLFSGSNVTRLATDDASLVEVAGLLPRWLTYPEYRQAAYCSREPLSRALCTPTGPLACTICYRRCALVPSDFLVEHLMTAC
jgi:hypothetical protein